MSNTIYCTLFFALLVGLAPTPSKADVAPPDSYGCNSAEAGDSCKTDDGKAGACVSETCSGLDYSNRDDAGAPTSKSYPCLICSEDAADGCSAVPHRGGPGGLLLLLTLLFE